MNRLLLSLLALSALLILSGAATAQIQDEPLIGTWNISLGSAGIAVMTFNAGGTTVEYDTGGNNPSGNPGESIALGKWYKSAKPAKYSFKEQNYIYDDSGNLEYIAIASCGLTLAPGNKSFTDSCTVRFYTCSVATCPGALVSTQSGGSGTGTRF